MRVIARERLFNSLLASGSRPTPGAALEPAGAAGWIQAQLGPYRQLPGFSCSAAQGSPLDPGARFPVSPPSGGAGATTFFALVGMVALYAKVIKPVFMGLFDENYMQSSLFPDEDGDIQDKSATYKMEESVSEVDDSEILDH